MVCDSLRYLPTDGRRDLFHTEFMVDVGVNGFPPGRQHSADGELHGFQSNPDRRHCVMYPQRYVGGGVLC